MSYDLLLAQRIREHMELLPGFSEKKMFGGVGFLLHGNMACGVSKNDLILRVGIDEFDELVKLPHIRIFDMTGKPMKGWLMVAPKGCASDDDLALLLEKGIRFALTLPPK